MTNILAGKFTQASDFQSLDLLFNPIKVEVVSCERVPETPGAVLVTIDKPILQVNAPARWYQISNLKKSYYVSQTSQTTFVIQQFDENGNNVDNLCDNSPFEIFVY